jgi:hypothetical protein
LAFSATSPFWIADNNGNVSTLYNGRGQAFPVGSPLVVNIPAPGAATGGTPTGLVFNGTGEFAVTAGGKSGSAIFLFSSEDGTIRVKLRITHEKLEDLHPADLAEMMEAFRACSKLRCRCSCFSSVFAMRQRVRPASISTATKSAIALLASNWRRLDSLKAFIAITDAICQTCSVLVCWMS